MIGVNTGGKGKSTSAFLARAKSAAIASDIQSAADAGVRALSAATPVESGQTARSWDYEIEKSKGGIQIRWFNTHENRGANIALLLQYGHATGTGGYVQGRGYINTAMKPVFDKTTSSVWGRIIR